MEFWWRFPCRTHTLLRFVLADFDAFHRENVPHHDSLTTTSGGMRHYWLEFNSWSTSESKRRNSATLSDHRRHCASLQCTSETPASDYSGPFLVNSHSHSWLATVGPIYTCSWCKLAGGYISRSRMQSRCYNSRIVLYCINELYVATVVSEGEWCRQWSPVGMSG